MTGPTIACHLSEPLEALLAAHASAPRIVSYTRQGAALWDVPPDADVLFTFAQGWRKAPAEAPKGWPFKLQYIQIAAAGVDAFPGWFFEGPPVSCGRGITSTPIAEWVFAAMLAQEKKWASTRVTARADWRQVGLGCLEGKTVGLLGVGAIGQAIARRALAFNMRVLAVRRDAQAEPLPGIALVDTLAALAAQSHHLVVCAPLTPHTRHLLGREALAAAAPGLHVINVSRGAIIDDAALLEALDDGRVAAATLDVTEPEPLPEGHPFYSHPRVWLTSHISWASDHGDDRIAAKLLDNLERKLRGEPLLDIVDAARGY